MPSLHAIKMYTASCAWWLAAVLLLAPLGRHAMGVVLCVGSDGHIQAELAAGASCIPSPEHAAAHAAGSSVDADGGTHCGPCTDIPIPAGSDTDCVSYKSERGPTAQVSLPLSAAQPASYRPTSPSPPAMPVPGPSSSPPPGPVLLRSVVLLI